MKTSVSPRNKRRSTGAFSFVEVLIGMVILQIALLSFFLINQSSSSQSMDAYYEFLAASLGSEVVEFTQGMGYEWADKFIAKPDIFPLDTWHGVLEKPIFAATSYFRECDSFERMISMKKVSSRKARSTTGVISTRVDSFFPFLTMPFNMASIEVLSSKTDTKINSDKTTQSHLSKTTRGISA